MTLTLVLIGSVTSHNELFGLPILTPLTGYYTGYHISIVSLIFGLQNANENGELGIK